MPWGSLSQNQITVLLRLLGGGPYKAEVTSSAAATRRLGTATQATGLAMQTASRRTGLMNQALYTVRRYAFFGTVAVLGLAAGLLKLGYSYLSTRDSATAALKPIFANTQALNRELDVLFGLSKYSPFVLKDMTDALRVMYPALHNAGMSVHSMNGLMKSLTNILSASGKTTPAALSRISYAIQRMLNQGRLTGVLVRSLASAGVPINLLLKQMGVAQGNLSNIARLNISPQSVIEALIRLTNTNTYFKGAALRISMNSFSGMLQVARDSLSQFMGLFLSGGYNKFKSELARMIGKGGLLDRLSNIKQNAGPQAALMGLSTALTGGKGLGQGLMLLAHIAGNLGAIFLHAVVPAFAVALHTLILFWPLLWPLNQVLGFLAHHATLVKWALIPLAAWFVITHGAMMGMYISGKLLDVMMFGNMKTIRRWIAILAVAEGRAATMATITRLWRLAMEGENLAIGAFGPLASSFGTKATRMEKTIIALRTAVITTSLGFWKLTTAIWASIVAAYADSGAIGVLIGALTMLKWAIFSIPVVGWILLAISVLAILAWKFRSVRQVILDALNPINNAIKLMIHYLEKALGLLNKVPLLGRLLHFGTRAAVSAATGGIIPAFQHGGVSPGGLALVGEGGPEIVNLSRGSSVTPIEKKVNPIAALSGAGDGRPIIIHLNTHLNRRILAEEVIRVQQDKEARQ